jgi:hypothetical protein
VTSWTDTYTPRSRKITVIHQGGPADGTEIVVPLARLPQVRYYATAADRRRRVIRLHRYVQHARLTLDQVLFLYTGTEEKPGPIPGSPADPEWS